MDTATKMAREIERFLSWYSATKAEVAGEEALREALKKLFTQMSNEIIKKLGKRMVAGDNQKGAVSNVIQDVTDKLKDTLFEHVKTAAETGAIDASEGVGLGVEGKVSGDVLELMKARVFEGADTTMSRVSGDVMGYLQDAYDQGMGVDEAARYLRDNVFDGMKTWEAERIARTEIHSAQGQGTAAILDEYADYEQWVTCEDDKVRPSHAELDGQIVRAGDPYSNGLQYPGDMNGDIEEWIECRCLQVAYSMPAGMMAPEMDYFTEDDLVEVPTEEAPTEEEPDLTATEFTDNKEAHDWGNTEFGAWQEGLSEEGSSAVETYGGPQGFDLDAHLRGESFRLTSADDASLDTLAKSLDQALTSGTAPTDFMTYRGMGLSEETLSEVMQSKTIADPAFLSTSLDQGNALGYAQAWASEGRQPVVAEILVPQGSSCGYMDVGKPVMDSNLEVLLPRDSRLELVGTNEVDGVTHLIMRVMR